MTAIDNNIKFSNNCIKTAQQKEIKNSTVVGLPAGKLSEFKDVEFLKAKNRIINIYDNICNRINLNEQIRPQLEFDTMGIGTAGFENTSATICFDNSFIKELENKDIIFILRHELEHVKQFQNMRRMLGEEKFVNLIVTQDENCSDKNIPGFDKVNIDYYKKVENTLGKIDKNSAEGILTQKYIDAYKKYPDLNKIWQRTDICKATKLFLCAKEYILNYKFNILETDANRAAKKFLKDFRL